MSKVLLLSGVSAIASAQAPGLGSQTAADSRTPDVPGYVPSMTFDVASVKEAKVDMGAGFTVGGGFIPYNGTHLRMVNVTIENLVERAYGINFLRIEWPKDQAGDLMQTRFTVEAKADAEASERFSHLNPDEIAVEQQHMLQALLQERFNLKAQWVTRDAKTYDLVVVKKGRMQESTGAPPSADDLKVWGDRPIPVMYLKGSSTGGVEHIAHAATMADIVKMIATEFRHPVTDKTGLTGKYDFDVKSYQVYSAERKDDETNPWPTLSAALQDQLGLKVVPAHGPVAMLVVEQIEKPTAD
jgi:uncharacterized protein (TIGR03435 family)